MSFGPMKEEPAWNHNAFSEFEALQPMDLKHEQLQLLNQHNQQIGFTPQHPFVTGSRGNPGWNPEGMQLPPHSGLTTGQGNEFEFSTNVDYSRPALNFENGSQSSGSSPSLVGSLALPTTNAPEKDATTKLRRTRGKKQFFDDRETQLLETDDSKLTEDELVLKKKAQNRMAQRAFRERKETKLRELELKLLRSEDERQKLMQKLDDIRSQYILVLTENKFLRLNGELVPMVAGGGSHGIESSKFTFPQSQDEFIEEMIDVHLHEVNEATMNKVYDEPLNPGRKVLAIGAVWDYLQIKREEEGYENLDMLEVMQNLKGNEVCHGYGPAYPLELVTSVLDSVNECHERE